MRGKRICSHYKKKLKQRTHELAPNISSKHIWCVTLTINHIPQSIALRIALLIFVHRATQDCAAPPYINPIFTCVILARRTLRTQLFFHFDAP